MNGSYDPYPDFSPLYEPTSFSWWLFSDLINDIKEKEIPFDAAKDDVERQIRNIKQSTTAVFDKGMADEMDKICKDAVYQAHAKLKCSRDALIEVLEHELERLHENESKKRRYLQKLLECQKIEDETV